MVGRDVVLRVQKGEAKVAHQVLEVKDLVVLDDRKLKAVNGLSLTVNAGEILGVAGVEGNGQREFVEAIAGMRQVVSGTIMMKQELDITKSDPYEVHAANVGHIPEDREKHGLVASYSIADNLVLNRFDEPEFAAKGIRNFSAINTNAEALVEKFDVRTSSIKSSAASLSGGNKQKVVVARELSAQPELLVASQPTRGVDVGSIEFIHNQIIAARDAGAGVLLVSAELDEILSLSDRIVVVHQGRVVAEMSGANADRGAIGRLMAGGQA
jgi:simple sugar transport system ATP-binding protein